ncbi:MAG: hypothetical protein NC395_08520 [Prevotella sp.]|nr:hypothetical protein [Prevotella sp.]
MGFIGGVFVVIAVVIVFIAASVGVILKLRKGEPLFGDEDGKRMIPKHIAAVFAVIGAFGILPYAFWLLIVPGVWVLLCAARGKSLDIKSLFKAAEFFLAAVGAVFFVFITVGLIASFFSALFGGQLSQ